MRLSFRIALAMAAAALIPLVIAARFSMTAAIENDTVQSDEILLRDATGMATFLETWTSGQIDTLAGWTVPFRLGDEPGLQEGLLRAVVLAMPSVVGVVLVDPEGNPVGTPQFLARPGQNQDHPAGNAPQVAALVQRLPISEALSSRREARAAGTGVPLGWAVGEPYLSEGIYPSVPVAVAGPHDETLVLGAELSLGEVARLLDGQTTPVHALAVLTGTGAPVFGADHALIDEALLQPILASGANSTLRYDAPAGRARGAVATVPSTGWRVLVVEPAAQVEATAGQIQRRMIEAILVAALLSVALGAVLARSLAAPVGELRDAANAVADGELGRTANIGRGDEIGELAAAFNQMSRRLLHDQGEIRRQRSEIEAFNVELQQRVDDRTRELVDAQQRLVQSGQLAAVAELGAGMAHELNNPLAAILGLTQLLRVRAKGLPEEAQLMRIEEQATRCREVAATLLRLTEGPVDPDRSSVVDLRPLLREVVQLVGGAFRQRGVSLVLDSENQPIPARIDGVAASRILAQVLHSFRAGLPPGASLRIDLAIEVDQAQIRFWPDRPLAQGEARDDWRAAGMGLWVARRELETWNGRLEEGDPWRLSVPKASA